MEDCYLEASEPTISYGNIKSFAKKLDEFHTYIDNISPMIPNYGELNQYFERWYPGFPVANDVNHDLHEVMLAA